ncbi:CU044_5270 family protein [Streptomyces sp. NPDC016566]|uniref:CU044_5270 family protein n=1 Tax=Streptomyces sp. NPDC016566 TaxID=3364967 RepID=UPI0037033357
MRLVAAARPAYLDPGKPVDETTRSTELAQAMAQPRRRESLPRSAWRSARPSWGLGLVGAAAAAALVVATTATHPSGDPNPGGVSAGASDASRILLAAAEQASQRPDLSGRYWKVETVERNLTAAATEKSPYTIKGGSRVTEWTDTETGRSFFTDYDLGFTPTGPSDVAAWKRAGSPKRITVWAPFGKAHLQMRAPDPGTNRSPDITTPEDGKPYFIGRAVSLEELQSLPSDPQQLKANLLKGFDRAAARGRSRDEWLFSACQNLILDLPVTSEVRAATFRMLSGLKGLTTIDRAKDAQGRWGTAVALRRTIGKDGGLVEDRLVFDASTSAGLARESVIVKADGKWTKGFMPGTIKNSLAVVRTVSTDEGPERWPAEELLPAVGAKR